MKGLFSIFDKRDRKQGISYNKCHAGIAFGATACDAILLQPFADAPIQEKIVLLADSLRNPWLIRLSSEPQWQTGSANECSQTAALIDNKVNKNLRSRIAISLAERRRRDGHSAKE
ncbi:hypothetical protein [Aeromonas jandaei]|uniref:hypothetical protein n=1 Tax=Aeromonas jandaei TaxID=650 RepID=UPI00111679F5|nr:hypothetical protein [Aeromonas jandaei]